MGYKEAGIEKYLFLATLDLKTSEICRKLDLKSFSVSEAEVGVNLPPMHPFCRSVTVPGTDSRKGTRWARDPITGKSITVPANMTYQQWYDKYVKKKLKGLSADNDKDNKNNNRPKLIKTIDYNDKNAIIQELDKFEKESINLLYESNCTVTSDGKVWCLDGSSGFVETDLIETQKGGSNLKGSYSYHNHPKKETYFSFSGNDVGFFLEKEQIYSKASDYKYIYVMKSTKDTIPANYDDIISEFGDLYQKNVYQMSVDGLIDIDEDGYHETIKLLSKKYGFQYERIKNSD